VNDWLSTGPQPKLLAPLIGVLVVLAIAARIIFG
jgi:hypothetical protein